MSVDGISAVNGRKSGAERALAELVRVWRRMRRGALAVFCVALREWVFVRR